MELNKSITSAILSERKNAFSKNKKCLVQYIASLLLLSLVCFLVFTLFMSCLFFPLKATFTQDPVVKETGGFFCLLDTVHSEVTQLTQTLKSL